MEFSIHIYNGNDRPDHWNRKYLAFQLRAVFQWWRFIFHTICYCNSDYGNSIFNLEYGLGFSFKKSFSNLMHSIRPEFEIIAWMLVLLVFIVVIYYMIILGWDFAYLLNSFNFGWGNDPASFFTNYVGGSSNLSSATTILLPTLICTLIL